MKSNLYTRTGDMGTTALVGGQRISKSATRLEAYGTVDELNSWLGLLTATPGMPDDDLKLLTTVQHRLFNLGAYLATPVEPGQMPQVNGLSRKAVNNLERAIDRLDIATPALKSFILPGGTQLAAMTHIARTVCRRAERRVITLAEQEYVDTDLVRYLNRLSDYLFTLARYLNHLQGVKDTPWQQLD